MHWCQFIFSLFESGDDHVLSSAYTGKSRRSGMVSRLRLLACRCGGAHYSRLRTSSVDRVALLESVAQLGIQLDDIALRAQAIVGLGDELMLTGDRESGLNLYRQVLQMLAGSQVPVLASPARRALRLHE